MASMKKFAFIWCGIGAPVGVYTGYDAYHYFLRNETKPDIYAKFLFTNFALTAGIISTLNWPISYPSMYYYKKMDVKIEEK
tara:strand:- start:259 stop:501 length:243 start_codon:yes stop_codon:yes gene_type:complete